MLVMNKRGLINLAHSKVVDGQSRQDVARVTDVLLAAMEEAIIGGKLVLPRIGTISVTRFKVGAVIASRVGSKERKLRPENRMSRVKFAATPTLLHEVNERHSAPVASELEATRT